MHFFGTSIKTTFLVYIIFTEENRFYSYIVTDNIFHRTPLILAVEECMEECVDTLIKSGANLEATDYQGYSAEKLAEMSENEV